MSGARLSPRPATAALMSVLLCALLPTGVAAAATTVAATDWPCDENANAQFEALVNQARTQAGLNTLPVNAANEEYACYWSNQQMATQLVHHSPDLHALENVGADWTVQAVFDDFMASPGHRAAIMGTDN